MDLILCHQTADFDALGAAVGLSRLNVGAKIVLTGGAHPAVRDFLALHRDELALIEQRSVNPKQLRSLIVVDNQQRDRLGKAAAWLTLANLESLEIYDHHLDHHGTIPATQSHIEAVGAATTLIVERLQGRELPLTTVEATVMALGIHVDTGSLTFENATPRDAQALAWLMAQGANLRIIAAYVEPSLTPQLQSLFTTALAQLQKTEIEGHAIATVVLNGAEFVPGLSNLTERLIELTECAALFVVYQYRQRMTVIGRSRIPGTNLHQLFAPLGGGGHAQAASAALRGTAPEELLSRLVAQLAAQIPQAPTARDLMSAPVRTIRPEITIRAAQRILFRYGHSGLSVVDETDQLVGIISRRDLDLALHHGFSHAPVKGYMTRNLKTITPETTVSQIESLMVTYDVGRLPVLDAGQLVGIVTRTDILRQIHRDRTPGKVAEEQRVSTACLLPSICDRLAAPMGQLLTQAAQQAQQRGWHLYLVGGAVRDLLLAESDPSLLLQDIDLVVDGFHESADVGAGVNLAKALCELHPEARLSVHGAFQTAAVLWHKDPDLGSLWLDIATARTEFYPYPAANPEVEASSIRQDLYRRDFTINALAVRLTQPAAGELLDFFGGTLDLRSRQIRVLHANSFIEDPTRIYRAVRFAVRLNFTLEPQTEAYIRYAIASGVYQRLRHSHQQAPALTTRLKTELKHILQAPYWKRALQLLNRLDALRCLHDHLHLTPTVWWQIRCGDRWLRFYDAQHHLEHWQIRLMILLAELPPSERITLASQLQLPQTSIEQLTQLNRMERNIPITIPSAQRPSDWAQALSAYSAASIILFAVRSPKPLRHQLWRYLMHWSQVRAPLNGHDLQALGYQPGPHFKHILTRLRYATLDGDIRDRPSAKAFLTHYFPLKSNALSS